VSIRFYRVKRQRLIQTFDRFEGHHSLTMPQNPHQKKKKKGHAPKHQNKFAYKHNPKSKTTAKILASPNIHVCRRCHEKIEWRKQYRKYKPRTQPGTCNGCKKRNVLAAYHTICTSCTTESTKAKELIQAEMSTSQEDEGKKCSLRACAICVKEIALPEPEEEEEDVISSLGRIRLRDRRAIERHLAKEGTKSSNDTTVDSDEEEDAKESRVFGDANESDNEEDDPFLRAVGGSDKLLTGEAYQKKLLEDQS